MQQIDLIQTAPTELGGTDCCVIHGIPFYAKPDRRLLVQQLSPLGFLGEESASSIHRSSAHQRVPLVLGMPSVDGLHQSVETIRRNAVMRQVELTGQILRWHCFNPACDCSPKMSFRKKSKESKTVLFQKAALGSHASLHHHLAHNQTLSHARHESSCPAKSETAGPQLTQLRVFSAVIKCLKFVCQALQQGSVG